MASGFFALLDDIAALMDDVAAMSKIATKKTAGILGDDLAVNAEKASGFVSSREIPILWAITKGSFLNKLIILPIAFLLSAFAPWAVTLTLLLGAIYLAYEGAEKIYEYVFPPNKEGLINKSKERSTTEILALEKIKIKSAILTDFILSIEIVIIALGTVLEQNIYNQIAVVTLVAILATVGVYGIVVLIVRMDDLGIKLIQLSDKKKSITTCIGTLLVQTLPLIIKCLSVIGTIALILVAGGIYAHHLSGIEEIVKPIPSIMVDFIVGLLVGFTALVLYRFFSYLFLIKKSQP
jgi:hypothetical protein